MSGMVRPSPLAVKHLASRPVTAPFEKADGRYFRIALPARAPSLRGLGIYATRLPRANLRHFFWCKRPTLHDAFAHRVFLFRVDSIEAVVAQCAEQAFAFRNRTPVDDVSKCRAEINDIFWYRPIGTEMTGDLGIRHETNNYSFLIYPIWWLRSELITS